MAFSASKADCQLTVPGVQLAFLIHMRPVKLSKTVSWLEENRGLRYEAPCCHAPSCRVPLEVGS